MSRITLLHTTHTTDTGWRCGPSLLITAGQGFVIRSLVRAGREERVALRARLCKEVCRVRVRAASLRGRPAARRRDQPQH